MNGFPKNFSKDNTYRVRLEIEKHHRDLYLRQMVGSLIGSTVIAIIMIATLWNKQHSNSFFYLWLFSLILFISFRAIQGYMFYRSPINSKTARQWGNLLSVYAIGAGVSWGLAPYVFQISTTHELIFSALYASGLIASSVVSLSASMRDYLFFSGSISICMIVYHINTDYPHSNFTAFLFFLFFLCSLYFARNVMLQQLSSKNLVEKNIDLINKLVVEKDNAERSNKEKTHFIATASHDLRQPLHALGLYLDSLDRERSEEERKEILKKSKNSLKSLGDLFSSLLDISNIDAGAITIAPIHFHVYQLFEQITDQIKGGASEKNIKITTKVDIDQVVFCDPILTARCLRNVAINAIKHSECDEIKFECKSLENNIEISVTDNGKGIPEDSFDKVFEEFHQLDNPGRDRQKGLGLGLTIVKRLFELQGHSFNLRSKLGSGTTFSFQLPYGTNTKRYINNILYREKKEHKINFEKSILVIDDEQQVLDGMKIILNDWQQNVCIANSLEQAVSAVDKGFKPDVIISDYRLQDNNTGANVIQLLHKNLPNTTQIVFITGETEPKKIKEIRSHGYPLIHKPIMGTGLKSIIIRLHKNPKLGTVKVKTQ